MHNLFRVLSIGLVLSMANTASAQGTSTAPADWNLPAAMAALDAGALTWDRWERSQRSLDTTCISCHTGGPYLLARIALRSVEGTLPQAEAETNLLADVTRRVTQWTEVEPWYTISDPKEVESLGTESVWNAWILATRDAHSPDRAVRADTRAAFDILWAQQTDRGTWPWLIFGLDPWESLTAEPIGAAMAILAVAAVPGDYARTPEIQPALTRTKDFVRAEFARADQSLHTKTFILWAAHEMDEVLPDADRDRFTQTLIELQREDGGWSLADLGDYREEPQPAVSDAYATALIMLAIAHSENAAARTAVARGRAWLIAHQDPASGGWPLQSVNKKRDPETYPSQFMQDAAAAYAVLALLATV